MLVRAEPLRQLGGSGPVLLQAIEQAKPEGGDDAAEGNRRGEVQHRAGSLIETEQQQALQKAGNDRHPGIPERMRGNNMRNGTRSPKPVSTTRRTTPESPRLQRLAFGNIRL